MRALVVTHLPPPDSRLGESAVFQRLGMFIRAASCIADEVEVLHYISPEDLDRFPAGVHLDELQSQHWGCKIHVVLSPRATRTETLWNHYGAGIFSAYAQHRIFPMAADQSVSALQECLKRKPALLIAHRLPSMCTALRVSAPLPPVFFDLDDVEHRLRLANIFSPPHWPGKFAYLLHIPAVIAAELRSGRSCRNLFVCSEKDRLHMMRLGAGAGVVAIPNSAAMPAQALPPAAEPTVLYLGVYSYDPNAEAAERLIRRIWPAIRRQVPNARLIIAGRSPELIPSFSSNPDGVEFTGFVDSLENLYRRARVVCCPLLQGGGTRVKLIEAAGHSRPMVSTTKGAEGLLFENETEILIRDSDRALADACVRLLCDDALNARLAVAARNKALDVYSLDVIVTKIADYFRSALV